MRAHPRHPRATTTGDVPEIWGLWDALDLGPVARPRPSGGTSPASRHHKLTERRALSGHSRKPSLSAPQNAYFVPFLVGWANYFARRTQPRGDFETNDTSAAADAGQRETAITTATTDAGQHETAITTAHPSTATVETNNTSATEKHAKNTHFSPAKAMAVSVEARPTRAKASPVSDNRTPGLRDPATPPAGTYTPTPQQTRT